MRLAVALLTSLSLAACATGGGQSVAAAPDYSPIAGGAVSPNAQLVLACVSRAMQGQHMDMIGDDGDSRLIRFTCEGSEAQILFDALAERSAAIGSEWRDGAVVYRSTERINENLYGSDFCWRDSVSHGTEPATYACVFNLNLGGFISE